LKLNIVHLDESLKHQKDFIFLSKKYFANSIDATSFGSDLRLWAKNDLLNKFYEFLKKNWKQESNEPILTFFGSGDFHHVTNILLRIILAKHQELITVIHFDNHPDWVKFSNGIHCGSWVTKSLSEGKIDRVITIGANSKDLSFPEFKGANLKALREGKIILYPYNHKPSFVFGNYTGGENYEQKGRKIYWKNIINVTPADLLFTMNKQIKTSKIYISIDKDVLTFNDAVTNWDQGQVKFEYIIETIKLLKKKYNIIGADITGDYSIPKYTGSLYTQIMKRAEIMIDQSNVDKNNSLTNKINEITNIRLLNFFKDINL
jgi:arginase family enzyme